MPLYKWSQTSASNATADSTINWAEGQAPSSVNDSARAMMARLAEYRDDISGAIATSGTSTAYTVTSYQIFDSRAHMDGQMIAFVPHVTNGVAPTLNVDGLGVAYIAAPAGISVLAGALIAGTPYVATYNNSANEWRLHGFYGNPYNIPLGGFLDYAGSTAPNSNFILPYGQAVSRTTYATLFSLVSTTFGSGDGSTTFNVPDLRGRVIAAPDGMGGTAANRLTTSGSGINGDTIGAAGGEEKVTLDSTQIPAHSHPNTLTDPGHFHNDPNDVVDSGATAQSGPNGPILFLTAKNTSSATTGITINNFNNTGGGGAHHNAQPTIVLNKIMRVI